MTGGSVEATLELWASSLRDVKGRIRPLFRQERIAGKPSFVANHAGTCRPFYLPKLAHQRGRSATAFAEITIGLLTR